MDEAVEVEKYDGGSFSEPTFYSGGFDFEWVEEGLTAGRFRASTERMNVVGEDTGVNCNSNDNEIVKTKKR